MSAKILVIPGSLRTGSHNARLAALAAKELTLLDADVTRISLADFPLPIYDADLEVKTGVPANAAKLKQMIGQHAGVFIACPEYNASVTPVLKNTIDWVSRVREKGEPPLAVFRNRVFALGAASPMIYGGMRSIMAMRQVLEVGCGALVVPEFVAIPRAEQAFDEKDELIEPRAAAALRTMLNRLIEMARLVGVNDVAMVGV
ncbi:MAG: NAD(P)H-dependent oxidoreductase [Pseudolabrys sp.]|nr:NAD(P)H-dependent oxidoreductase [Pseudolabrys sp.]